MTMTSSDPTDGLPRVFEQIVLRRLNGSDLADFQAYRGDPEVARYQGWSAMTDAEAQSFLLQMAKCKLLEPSKWCQIGITLNDHDTLIGDIGICVSADGSEAEIGVSMAQHAQKKGLASDAVREAIRLVFEHSNVARVIGVTDARNTSSINLIQRIGMVKRKEFESEFRGEPCTEILFTISRNAVME